MDWTKAKSLLIVALLLTNIMLISVYFLQQTRNDVAQDNVTKNTIALLESKAIHVKTEVPHQKKRMPVLSVERSEINQDTINDQIKNQKGMDKKEPNEQDYLLYCETFLEKCGIYTEHTEFIEMNIDENSGADLIFGTVFENFSIEKSQIVCRFSHGKITSVDGKWYNPVKFGDTKKRTMTASTALIKFMSQMEETSKESGVPHGDITVDKIELVYWLDEYSLGEGVSVSGDTAFPAWKITYNGNQQSYIVAYEQ